MAKLKKVLLLALMAATFAFGSLALASCSKIFDSLTSNSGSSTVTDDSGSSSTGSDSTGSGNTPDSTIGAIVALDGLEYTLNDDGKSYSVTGIGTCTNTDIVIPSTYNDLPVTDIGESAFYGCSSLTSIIFNGTEEEWNAIMFGGDWNYNTGNYTVTFAGENGTA